MILDVHKIETFNSKEISMKYLKNEKILYLIEAFSQENKFDTFEPEYSDLARLHFLARNRRVINVLEFGSGYSTFVFEDAMKKNHDEFYENIDKSLRFNKFFHVFSVEENSHYLEISKRRLKYQDEFITFHHSSVEQNLHDNRVVTFYTNLPNISPDLIYLDGPSQSASTKQINGIGTNSVSRMPMSADILRFEFFLEPGTLILVDGRTNNARLLKTYLKREWDYYYNFEGDFHIFELKEAPIGLLNEKKINFCLGKDWLK